MLWAFQDFASDKNIDTAIGIRYGVLQGDGMKGITAAQRCVGACKTENVVLNLQAAFKWSFWFGSSLSPSNYVMNQDKGAVYH